MQQNIKSQLQLFHQAVFCKKNYAQYISTIILLNDEHLIRKLPNVSHFVPNIQQVIQNHHCYPLVIKYGVTRLLCQELFLDLNNARLISVLLKSYTSKFLKFNSINSQTQIIQEELLSFYNKQTTVAKKFVKQLIYFKPLITNLSLLQIVLQTCRDNQISVDFIVNRNIMNFFEVLQLELKQLKKGTNVYKLTEDYFKYSLFIANSSDLNYVDSQSEFVVLARKKLIGIPISEVRQDLNILWKQLDTPITFTFHNYQAVLDILGNYQNITQQKQLIIQKIIIKLLLPNTFESYNQETPEIQKITKPMFLSQLVILFVSICNNIRIIDKNIFTVIDIPIVANNFFLLFMENPILIDLFSDVVLFSKLKFIKTMQAEDICQLYDLVSCDNFVIPLKLLHVVIPFFQKYQQKVSCFGNFVLKIVEIMLKIDFNDHEQVSICNTCIQILCQYTKQKYLVSSKSSIVQLIIKIWSVDLLIYLDYMVSPTFKNMFVPCYYSLPFLYGYSQFFDEQQLRNQSCLLSNDSLMQQSYNQSNFCMFRNIQKTSSIANQISNLQYQYELDYFVILPFIDVQAFQELKKSSALFFVLSPTLSNEITLLFKYFQFSVVTNNHEWLFCINSDYHYFIKDEIIDWYLQYLYCTSQLSKRQLSGDISFNILYSLISKRQMSAKQIILLILNCTENEALIPHFQNLICPIKIDFLEILPFTISFYCDQNFVFNQQSLITYILKNSLQSESEIIEDTFKYKFMEIDCVSSADCLLFMDELHSQKKAIWSIIDQQFAYFEYDLSKIQLSQFYFIYLPLFSNKQKRLQEFSSNQKEQRNKLYLSIVEPESVNIIYNDEYYLIFEQLLDNEITISSTFNYYQCDTLQSVLVNVVQTAFLEFDEDCPNQCLDLCYLLMEKLDEINLTNIYNIIYELYQVHSHNCYFSYFYDDTNLFGYQQHVIERLLHLMIMIINKTKWETELLTKIFWESISAKFLHIKIDENYIFMFSRYCYQIFLCGFSNNINTSNKKQTDCTKLSNFSQPVVFLLQIKDRFQSIIQNRQFDLGFMAIIVTVLMNEMNVIQWLLSQFRSLNQQEQQNNFLLVMNICSFLDQDVIIKYYEAIVDYLLCNDMTVADIKKQPFLNKLLRMNNPNIESIILSKTKLLLMSENQTEHVELYIYLSQIIVLKQLQCNLCNVSQILDLIDELFNQLSSINTHIVQNSKIFFEQLINSIDIEQEIKQYFNYTLQNLEIEDINLFQEKFFDSYYSFPVLLVLLVLIANKLGKNNCTLNLTLIEILFTIIRKNKFIELLDAKIQSYIIRSIVGCLLYVPTIKLHYYCSELRLLGKQFNVLQSLFHFYNQEFYEKCSLIFVFILSQEQYVQLCQRFISLQVPEEDDNTLFNCLISLNLHKSSHFLNSINQESQIIIVCRNLFILCRQQNNLFFDKQKRFDNFIDIDCYEKYRFLDILSTVIVWPLMAKENQMGYDKELIVQMAQRIIVNNIPSYKQFPITDHIFKRFHISQEYIYLPVILLSFQINSVESNVVSFQLLQCIHSYISYLEIIIQSCLTYSQLSSILHFSDKSDSFNYSMLFLTEQQKILLIGLLNLYFFNCLYNQLDQQNSMDKINSLVQFTQITNINIHFYKIKSEIWNYGQLIDYMHNYQEYQNDLTSVTLALLFVKAIMAHSIIEETKYKLAASLERKWREIKQIDQYINENIQQETKQQRDNMYHYLVWVMQQQEIYQQLSKYKRLFTLEIDPLLQFKISIDILKRLDFKHYDENQSLITSLRKPCYTQYRQQLFDDCIALDCYQKPLFHSKIVLVSMFDDLTLINNSNVQKYFQFIITQSQITTQLKQKQYIQENIRFLQLFVNQIINTTIFDSVFEIILVMLVNIDEQLKIMQERKRLEIPNFEKMVVQRAREQIDSQSKRESNEVIDIARHYLRNQNFVLALTQLYILCLSKKVSDSSVQWKQQQSLIIFMYQHFELWSGSSFQHVQKILLQLLMKNQLIKLEHLAYFLNFKGIEFQLLNYCLLNFKDVLNQSSHFESYCSFILSSKFQSSVTDKPDDIVPIIIKCFVNEMIDQEYGEAYYSGISVYGKLLVKFAQFLSLKDILIIGHKIDKRYLLVVQIISCYISKLELKSTKLAVYKILIMDRVPDSHYFLQFRAALTLILIVKQNLNVHENFDIIGKLEQWIQFQPGIIEIACVIQLFKYYSKFSNEIRISCNFLNVKYDWQSLFNQLPQPEKNFIQFVSAKSSSDIFL